MGDHSVTRSLVYLCGIVYCPGSHMILADTLSHLPKPENNEDIELDEHID